MKTLKYLTATLLMASLTTACLNNDDPYQAGFLFMKPQYGTTSVYANTPSDSVIFYSYGRWSITNQQGYDNTWARLAETKGYGNSVSHFPVTFEPNTTGHSRIAVFYIEDTSHPGDAHASFAYLQHATRGDGSLGSAALVSAINGSDGSRIELAYDHLFRPTKLVATKNDAKLHDLQLVYNDYDSTMVVTSKGQRFTASMTNDYQPGLLVSSTDTIGYYRAYYSNGIPIDPSFTFQIQHRTSGKAFTAYSYLLNGQPLYADSLHNADSLRYVRLDANGEQVALEKLKLNYSLLDNRCQSVDVNQLLLGVEECNPCLLLSLFRYARNTSIVSSATTESDQISVATELNADKSVRQLAVTRKGNTITYTFEY